jgi:hypothetical protein
MKKGGSRSRGRLTKTSPKIVKDPAEMEINWNDAKTIVLRRN